MANIRKAFIGVGKDTATNMQQMLRTVEELGKNIGELLKQNEQLKRVQLQAGMLHGEKPNAGNVKKIDGELQRVYNENRKLLAEQKQQVKRLSTEMGYDEPSSTKKLRR